MATNGRGTSESGTGTKTARSDAPKFGMVVDDPVIETVDAKEADPVIETADSKVDPVIGTSDPGKGDPVVETSDPKKAQPVIGTSDPKKALAASEMDLAKLQAARRARLIKAGVLTAIALVFITFVLQNANRVGVQILGWTLSIRLIWVIVASALLGAGAGYLVGRPDKQLRLHGPNRRDGDPL